MSKRGFFVAFLVAALLVSGVASYYASGSPDGLEYVADDTGFLDAAEDSATADSPFADYTVRGVDNARLSVGLSGILGTLVVLVLMGGLAFAVRRRGSHDDHDRPAETSS